MPILKYNAADLHIKSIIKKSGLHGCNFNVPYYVYGIKNEDRPALFIRNISPSFSNSVHFALKVFCPFIEKNLKIAAFDRNRDPYADILLDHCHIAVRLDLREYEDLAGSLIKLFIGLCEGYIPSIPSGLKLKNVPNFEN